MQQATAQSAHPQRPKGVVAVASMRCAEPGDPGAFRRQFMLQLHYNDGGTARTLYAHTASAAEREDWLRALRSRVRFSL